MRLEKPRRGPELFSRFRAGESLGRPRLERSVRIIMDEPTVQTTLARTRASLAEEAQRAETPKRLPDSAVKKLAAQNGDTVRVFVTDIDGTVYTNLGPSILRDRKTGLQTVAILRDHSIPLVVNTGGDPLHPHRVQSYLKRLGGIEEHADAIIGNFGTVIYRRQQDGTLQRDGRWDGSLGLQEITVNGKRRLWGQGGIELVRDIEGVVMGASSAVKLRTIRRIDSDDRFCVKYEITDLSPTQRESFITAISSEMQGARIIYSESLKYNNSKNFSGTIAIIPSGAGKLNATEYLLQQYQTALRADYKKEPAIIAHAFGDASGDDFLVHGVKSWEGITILPHAVNTKRHPLTLANMEGHAKPTDMRIDIEQAQIRDGLTYIHKQPGPDAILQIARAVTGFNPNPKNSPFRNFSTRLAEWADGFREYRRLSANGVSLKSMELIAEAIAPITPANIFKRIRMFTVGYLGDLIDGYRAGKEDAANARSPQDKQIGQLLDGFRDRFVESMQLGIRAQGLLQNGKYKSGLNELEAMVSCVLPSLTRAQTEFLTGWTVPEGGKGSMFPRTLRLSGAFLGKLFHIPLLATVMDAQIRKNNLITYKNRRERSQFTRTTVSLMHIRPEDFAQNGLQIKALERFVLYASILQELNTIAQNMIMRLQDTAVRQKMISEFGKWRGINGIDEYLEDHVRIEDLRTRFHFVKDARLDLGNYVTVDKTNGLQFSSPAGK